jgi:cell division topological specificity factor
MKSVLKWFFGSKSEASGSTATNRMKLMVIHDRYQLPPAIVDQMKSELLAVASKYFEIDPESAECVIKSQGNRRAFISAIVPLLKRNSNDTNDNQPGQNKHNRRTQKKDSKNLSAGVA